MAFFDLAVREREQLTQRIQELESKIREAPEGSLICHKNGSRYKYYQQISNIAQDDKVHKKYLKKSESKIVTALAQKKIYQAQLKELKDQLHIITQYINAYDALPLYTARNLFQSEKLRRIFIENNPSQLPDIFPHTDSEIWQKEEYEKNPKHPEQLIVPTVRGINVRSKSEALIAFGLDMHKIPYRYECRLPIKRPEIYPDFTILQPNTGNIIIWEHFGMMDHPDYVHKASAKMHTYIENGYYPNENLIVTFETQNKPLGSAKVSWVINHLILQ